MIPLLWENRMSQGTEILLLYSSVIPLEMPSTGNGIMLNFSHLPKEVKDEALPKGTPVFSGLFFLDFFLNVLASA